MLVLIFVLCVVLNSSFIWGQNDRGTKTDYNGDKFTKALTQSHASNCTLQVEGFSRIFLGYWIELLHPQFVHYTLVFNTTTVIHALPTVIRPLKWVWTFRQPMSDIPYLNWPVDFPILSFGLLCTKYLSRELSVYINVTPSNCTIVLGYQNATLAIATALNNMTQTYFSQYHDSYNYSSWCYLAEIPGVRDTLPYTFALYLNYPADFIAYICCNSSFNYSTGSIQVSCPEKMNDNWREITFVPYVIGLVIFCYCPLILCCCGDALAATGPKIPAEHDYEDLEDSDKRQWIYLDGNAPISFTNLVCGLCDLGWKHPLAVSRLRRALCILFSPTLIFLQFLLHISYEGDMTLDLIDHRVPMGFLSMLGGMEKSKELFAPMLGGPYFLLCMYYITGFMFLLIPQCLQNVLQDGSLDSKYVGLSPLILSTERIEEISMIPVNRYHGYKRHSRLILARFYIILMPSFWFDALCTVCRRVQRHLEFLIKHLPKPVCIILYWVMVPLYLCFGSLEICFCLIYYSIPIIWFLLVVISGFVSRATTCIETRILINFPSSLRLTLQIAIYTIIGPPFFYFVYGFFLICLTSVSFVGEIIVFLFYARVLFPSTSFGYLLLGGALVYYICKLLKGIGDVYNELLSDMVEVCTSHDLEHNMNTLHKSSVLNEGPCDITINPLLEDDTSINLTEVHRKIVHDTANARVRKNVRYENHIPGISRSLFRFVVQRCKPVHITVFHAIFRIGLIVLLVIGTVRLSMDTNGMAEEISEVMHALFIVVIATLPRVLEITLSQSDTAVQKKIRQRILKMLIQEYNQMKTESIDPSSTE